MRNNLSFVVGAVVLIIFFALVAFAASKFYQRQSEKTLLPSPRPTPVSGFPVSSPSPQTLGQANTPAVQPESGSNTLEENNIRIFIESPSPSDSITSPFKSNGYTNLTSGVIIAQVKDINGQLLGQGSTMACMDYDACQFNAQVSFEKPSTQTGAVEVYSPSALDGSDQYLQTILIRFW